MPICFYIGVGHLELVQGSGLSFYREDLLFSFEGSLTKDRSTYTNLVLQYLKVRFQSW